MEFGRDTLRAEKLLIPEISISPHLQGYKYDIRVCIICIAGVILPYCRAFDAFYLIRRIYICITDVSITGRFLVDLCRPIGKIAVKSI